MLSDFNGKGLLMLSRPATLFEGDTYGQSDTDKSCGINDNNTTISDSTHGESSNLSSVEKSICIESTPEINLAARSRRRPVEIKKEDELSDTKSVESFNENVLDIDILKSHDRIKEINSLVVNASKPITVNCLL